MVEDGAGSRVTTILLNWCILPIGGASAVEGLRFTWLPRLIFTYYNLGNFATEA